MTRHLLIAAAVAGMTSAGCRQRCLLNDPGRRPDTFRPPAPNTPLLLPPTNVPTTPAPLPPAGDLIPRPGPGGGNFPAPPALDLPPVNPPARPDREVLLPEPIPGAGSSRAPSSDAPAPQPAEPPAGTAGLPGFVRVKDGLASGRKPTLDGFDTLKRLGYRTVVHLHPAGADVSATKDLAERRGLGFVAVEATPENLADAVARFNAAVGEKANRPAYVFDDDGVRAGAVWYLHFRTAEAMNDDAARVRAKPLGLTDQGDEAKAFALATQQYLVTR